MSFGFTGGFPLVNLLNTRVYDIVKDREFVLYPDVCDCTFICHHVLLSFFFPVRLRNKNHNSDENDDDNGGIHVVFITISFVNVFINGFIVTTNPELCLFLS